LAKLSVAYLLLCEAVFCFMSMAVGAMGLLARDLDVSDRVVGGLAVVAALVTFWAIFALIRKSGHSFLSSMAVGVIVVIVSLWLVWMGFHADSQGDGGEAALYGLALLVFAIPAFVVLSLPSTRRYIAAAGD
jgi:hypothetical protein